MFERLQPERPEAIIPISSKDGNKIWSLLQWCWVYQPGKRPSAMEVLKIMKEITQAGLKR
ncbi:hypothetical protein FRC12_001261 [Ceratobasidium sp. 428]|nr:hypothetical protein FRC12_001261 [Ceratobasidium sp. 428]